MSLSDTATAVHHYATCGLDNVWLKGGVVVIETEYGKATRIEDMDGLHLAIGHSLVELHRALESDEFRFLRKEMDLSQKRLGLLFNVSDQTIANYEKGTTAIPQTADVTIRSLYVEYNKETSNMSDLIQQLVDIDNHLEESGRSFVHGESGWSNAA